MMTVLSEALPLRPRDLSLCGGNGEQKAADRSGDLRPFPRLSRRSGRIPALPYPPLRCYQSGCINPSPSMPVQVRRLPPLLCDSLQGFTSEPLHPQKSPRSPAGTPEISANRGLCWGALGPKRSERHPACGWNVNHHLRGCEDSVVCLSHGSANARSAGSVRWVHYRQVTHLTAII